jgi:hypothetical protein
VARIIKVNDTEKAAATQSTVPNTDTMIAEITAKLKEATQQDEPDQQLVEQLQQQLTHLRAISRPIPTEPVYDGRTLAEWVALMRFEHKQSERVTAARNVIQLAETQPPARRAALVFEAVPIADANVYPNRGFEWLTYRSDWQNSGWFTAELAWPILTELPPQILEDQLAQSLASEDSDERYFALMVCLRASDRIREQGWAKVQRALDELIASSKQSEEQTVAQVVRAACEPDVSEAAKMLSAISSEDASVHVLLGMIYAAQERPQIATRERELEWVAHLLPRISSFETLDLVWTEGKAAVGPLRPIDWDNVTPAQQADINAVVQPLLQSFAERLDDVDAAQRDASAHLAAAANGRTLAVMIQQTDLTGETRDQAISLLDRRLKQVVEYRNHVEWTPNTENFFVAKLDSPAALGIALVLLTGEFPDSLRQPLRAQTGRLAEHNSSYSTSHPNKRWGGVRGNAFDANAWLPYEILMRFAEWFNMKEWDWARGYLIAVDPLLAVTFAMAGDDVVARVATQLMVGDGGALTRTGRSGPDVGIVTSMRRHAAFAERMRHEMNEAESLTTRHLAFLVWATAQDEPTITEQIQQWLTSDDVMEMRFAIHLVAGSPESRTVHAMLWQAIERLAARQRLSAAELEALIQIGTAEAGQLAADQMRALIQEIKDQPSGQPISQELKSEFDMGMFILASRYPEKFESLKPVLNQLDDAQFQRLKTTGFGWQKALELRE